MKHALLYTALFLASGAAQALTGTVTDANGKPIANAVVEVVDSGVELRTDAQGQFASDLNSVDELHIKAPGYSHKVLHLHGDSAEGLDIVLRRSVMEQVDVIGLPLHLSTMESAQPIEVVSGEELRNKQASTLGETLKNEVGVHSSYFGPVASSPIIRGLDGPRVLITQNGLDVGDASRVGPDHVVATEASTAQQIEILRGPATLFYGSGAIGGVVNIVDDRVPSDSERKAAFILGHNTVADENEFSAAYTGGNERFAVHVDGFWRDSSDFKIPGIAELETAEEHEEEGHEEHAEGVLENSASESHGFNVGGSILLERGYVGLSYGRLDRLNGVPGHSEEDHADTGIVGVIEEEHGEDRVLSDLRQDRWQLISELQLDGALLSGVNTRIGYTDYVHREIHEGGEEHAAEEILGAVDHEEGTVFENQTWQARVDLLHQEWLGWRGALSIEGKRSDFEAIGAEAFTSPSTTDSFAVALMEEKHIGNLLWQAGARIESVHLSVDAITIEEHHDEEPATGESEAHEILHFDKLSFQPISLSAGVVWDYAPGYKASAALSHSQRAPTASELFAFGPHIGTGAYEVGALFELHREGEEVHLDYVGRAQKETANNLDLSLRKHEGDVGFVISAFYNEVSDFYYQHDTGLSTDDIFAHEEETGAEGEHEAHGGDLPVYIFSQADANFYGFEVEIAWQVAAPLKWTLWGDTTHGELDTGAYIPRLPPKRVGNQFNYAHDNWHAELSVVRYFEQDNIAINETVTDGYTMVDAHMSYRFDINDSALTLYAKANNLTNEEARVHSSFLKDRAPLPGRGFSVGLRGSF